MPDLVAPVGEIRDLDPAADAAAPALGRVGEPPHRTRVGAGEQHREQYHDADRDQEHLEHGEPLGLDHVVDVAALGREQHGAAHGAEALYRHRHRDDHLAAVVDADHARLAALQRVHDFGVAAAVLGSELAIERQIAAAEPGPDRNPGALDQSRGFGVRRRQIEPQYVAAAVEIAAVEDQHAVAIVDASAGPGRLDQAAQHRGDPLGVDGKLEPRERLVGGTVAFPRVQLQQPVGIDGDGVGLDRGGRRDRRRDDLALHQQALHARVDQAGAELRQIQDADHQREQTGDVEKQDAAG